MRHLTLHCPAKVNLYLKVIGRRSDGYHDLITLMQPVTLNDELAISHAAAGIGLECDHPDLPVDERNLAVRAAMAFQAAVSRRFGVRIRLKKNIPLAAGLGGGSSDAAGVLKGLNAISGKPLTASQLHQLARRLGADVPFFLLDGPAWGRGIGDVLTPVVLPTYCYVLVNPGYQISTAWAYSRLQPPFVAPAEARWDCWPEQPPAAWLHNDLEAVAMASYPDLLALKQALWQEGAEGVLMSGSGPTVFGIFADQAAASEAAERLRTATGFWTAAALGLSPTSSSLFLKDLG